MIRTLFLRRLWEQPVRSLVAVIAVAAGVALSSGVLIGRASIERTLDEYTDALAGVAELRVDGPVDQAGVPNTALAALRAVPGVEVVAPTVIATTRVEEPGGEPRYVLVLGIDCAVAPVCAPAGGLAVAPELLDDVEPGAFVRTNTGTLALDDATPQPLLSAVNGGRLLVLPLAEAQAAFARGDWFDSAFVTVADGASIDDVRAGLVTAAGPAAVVRSARTAPLGADAIALLLVGLLLVSIIGLSIGAQLIGNTLALSLEERRQELAIVAAVGATPAVLTRGVLVEAASLGAIGGLLGAGLGVLVAGPAIASLNDQFARGLGIEIDVQVPPVVLAVGVAIGVVVAVLAAIRPARRLARLDVAAELVDRDRSVGTAPGSRRVAVLATVGIVAGVVIAWLGARDGALQRWQPIAAVGGMALSITCGFPLPGQVARHLVGWISRRAAVTGSLRTALGGLAGDLRRTAVVTGAIAAPIAFGVCLGGIGAGLQQGARAMAEDQVAGMVEVSAIPVNNAMTLDAKLSPAEVATIAAVPGVSRVHGHYHAVLDHPEIGRVGLEGEDGPPAQQEVYRGAERDGPLEPGTAYLGPAFARDHGLGPGDELVVPGREGPVAVTVQGVWADPERLGRSISVDGATFARIAGPRSASYLLLEPAAGVHPAELRDRVADVAATAVRPGLIVADAPRLGEILGDEVDVFTAPFTAIQRGLLVVVVVATASTLLLSGMQRRREHALLGAIGMTSSSLAMVTFLEIAVLGVIGTAVGAAVGVAGAVAWTTASGVMTGLRFAVVWSVAPIVVAVVLAVVAALIGAVLPALRTARVDPATALRYE